MSESIDRDETSLVKHDETSVAYEAPDLREVGVFGDVTQGPATQQPEGNMMGMV
jgi:hypothetical protein